MRDVSKEFTVCECGKPKSRFAKQCRECYRKNKGHHADIYRRPKEEQVTQQP